MYSLVTLSHLFTFCNSVTPAAWLLSENQALCFTKGERHIWKGTRTGSWPYTLYTALSFVTVDDCCVYPQSQVFHCVPSPISSQPLKGIFPTSFITSCTINFSLFIRPLLAAQKHTATSHLNGQFLSQYSLLPTSFISLCYVNHKSCLYLEHPILSLFSPF